jgi:hypothetical protein
MPSEVAAKDDWRYGCHAQKAAEGHPILTEKESHTVLLHF